MINSYKKCSFIVILSMGIFSVQCSSKIIQILKRYPKTSLFAAITVPYFASLTYKVTSDLRNKKVAGVKLEIKRTGEAIQNIKENFEKIKTIFENVQEAMNKNKSTFQYRNLTYDIPETYHDLYTINIQDYTSEIFGDLWRRGISLTIDDVPPELHFKSWDFFAQEWLSNNSEIRWQYWLSIAHKQLNKKSLADIAALFDQKIANHLQEQNLKLNRLNTIQGKMALLLKGIRGVPLHFLGNIIDTTYNMLVRLRIMKPIRWDIPREY